MWCDARSFAQWLKFMR